MRKVFLLNELWNLSAQGAFQRSGVYAKGDRIDESLRHAFRKGLREYTDEELIPQYKQIVPQDTHLTNIEKLRLHAKSIDPGILKDGEFRYGIAQKLLNLYLKYLWVIDEIERPVHFPVDARIQEALRMGTDLKPWTKMTSEKEYMYVINKAKAILAGQDPKWLDVLTDDIKSIAELELYLFSLDSNY